MAVVRMHAWRVVCMLMMRLISPTADSGQKTSFINVAHRPVRYGEGRGVKIGRVGWRKELKCHVWVIS